MIKVIWATVAAAFSVAGAGWGAHAYLESSYAQAGDVKLAGAKADFVIDRQMAALIAEIAYLERKVKSRSEVEQLRYLRQQLDEMRRVRSGK